MSQNSESKFSVSEAYQNKILEAIAKTPKRFSKARKFINILKPIKDFKKILEKYIVWCFG